MARAAGEPGRFEYSQVQMGVSFTFILYAADEGLANRAAEAAFARVAELNGLLSDYDAQSELRQLCQRAPTSQPIPVSPELGFVLQRSQLLAQQTDGAFDVTVGPLIRLWRRARRSGEMPSMARREEAREAVGYAHLRVIDQHHVELLRPGMRLDLGGIAKGYAADEALAVFFAHGIRRVLIDASGDLVMGDPPPGAAGWRIGIAPLAGNDGPPSRYLSLARRAVATSGDAWQYVEIDGRRYSHIVDPHTGLGLTMPSSVTVVADDGISADSLATAVSVLGHSAGLKLIEATPGAAACIVLEEDGQVTTHLSQRLAALPAETP